MAHPLSLPGIQMAYLKNDEAIKSERARQHQLPTLSGYGERERERERGRQVQHGAVAPHQTKVDEGVVTSPIWPGMLMPVQL